MSDEETRTPMSLAEAESIARQLDHWGIDVGPGSSIAERRDAVPVVLLRELNRLRATGGAPTPMDPRDMHGLAIGEGVDAGNWYTYCPACSWDAGEQVGKCTEPVVAAMWPDASVFVPKPDGPS